MGFTQSHGACARLFSSRSHFVTLKLMMCNFLHFCRLAFVHHSGQTSNKIDALRSLDTRWINRNERNELIFQSQSQHPFAFEISISVCRRVFERIAWRQQIIMHGRTRVRTHIKNRWKFPNIDTIEERRRRQLIGGGVHLSAAQISTRNLEMEKKN